MKQPRTKLADFIAGEVLNGGDVKKLSQEVAAYLLTERRTSELESVLRDVRERWAQAGRVEVLAMCAYPLAAEAKANITREVRVIYPSAKQVIVTEVHDPSVIGGVRLSLANQQWDMSVEAKLNRFKQLTLAGKD